MLKLHMDTLETECKLTRQVFWFTFLHSLSLGGVVQLDRYELQSRPTRRHKYRATQIWDRKTTRHYTPAGVTWTDRPWVPQYMVSDALDAAKAEAVAATEQAPLRCANCATLSTHRAMMCAAQQRDARHRHRTRPRRRPG